jgi:hypothetical protein
MTKQRLSAKPTVSRVSRAGIELLTIAAAIGLAAPPAAANGGSSKPTKITDGPDGGGSDPTKKNDDATLVPLTKGQKEQAAAKDAALTSGVSAMSFYESRFLDVHQQAQNTSFYCGPAASSELLMYLTGTHSQGETAYWLGTDRTSQTSWYDSSLNYPSMPNRSGYPMPDAINYLRTGNAQGFYIPVGLPGAPSQAQKDQFKSRMSADIDGGYPVVGDAWEAVGGPHLVGHPVNQKIFHWFTIRGYTQYGAGTNYKDSASGASSISWSGNVPAESTMDTNTIAQILGGRGYVW